MRQLTIDERFVPLNPEDISHVETKFEITFPRDLILFLSLHQGAITSECEFPCPDEDDPDGGIIFSSFLEVRFKGNNFSIERWLENYNDMKTEGPRYDRGSWIPIASDIGSNHACYSLNPDTFGQIFMYYPYDGNENPFFFICATLEEFVDALFDPNTDDTD
jgi:cell wall assembly regulator SMI1